MTEDLVAMARAAEKDERLSDGALYGKLAHEIERLQAAKRRALSVADERAKESEELRAENERLLAALWPFAMNYRIKSGYCQDDFRRASEAFPAEPVVINQQSGDTP